MITLSGLGKNFGQKTLFEGVSLQLNPGERYGLVGANGSGKTTFLKILAGDEPADGQITFGKSLRLGVLRQDRFADDSQRIVDVAMRGDAEVFEALREHERLSDEANPDAARIIALNDLIAHGDGYTLEARAREVLVGLGLHADNLDRALSTLSGGFKLRVLLAQVLVSRPDVLLLDEPTNHLDILSIRWLERFLLGYKGCAVIISHDRRFLDAVATRMLDVDYQTVIDYPGNYTSFLEQKEQTRERKEVEIARTERIVAEKKAFIERFRYKASKARQAQSRVKQLEKIEIPELVKSSRMAPRFKFEQARPSGRDVLKLDEISKSYGDHVVLKNVSLEVRRGEKVALIGANGIGKSTLLKIVVAGLEPNGGTHEWGHAASVGYFAQDHHDLLNDPKLTPLSFVWDACPTEPTNYVRGQLGRMLFSGDDVDKSVASLSGGEAARVIFARLAVEKPNVLVLDEPTNHLDLETIEALLEALRVYEGTLIFVSHDRYFVGRLATRVIELKADGLVDFKGTYDEYIERDGDDHLDVETVELKAKRDKKTPSTDEAKLSWEERKKRKNRQKALPKRRDALMLEIEALEAERNAILSRYSEPTFYMDTPNKEIEALEAKKTSLDRSIERLMQEWESIEAELTELAQDGDSP
ncbi:MAG TPA: ABC-F family ATP-binding cassette domain-containing protein [Polyangiaceae bacterium]